jgi:acetolactate synthase-1/2/3 large subunit
VCKLAQRVDRPERIALAVHEAFAVARSGRPGPVHLNIPGDVLSGYVEHTDTQGVVPSTPPSLGDTDVIREAVNLLARAERPVMVAGSGVFYAKAEEALRRLAEAAGLPVVTPIWDRGVVSRPMPEYLGVIGAASGSPALLPDADLILLVGGRVDYRLGYLQPPAVKEKARVIRIDRDPRELNQGVLPDVGILGDPSMVLDQVRDEWLRRHLPSRTDWLREAQSRTQRFHSRWARPPAPSPMTGHHLVEAIRGTLTDDTIFLIDGGNIGQWAHVLLWDRYPGHWLTCGASAVVGWGLPAAIAAKLLHPTRPVLLLSGDGAIGFTITELETAVRHRVPLVAVVADDQAWGIVASDQKRSWGEPIASLLGPVDYARVAQGFGARGVTVTQPDEVAPAIREAFASGQPTLIEVPIALRAPTE